MTKIGKKALEFGNLNFDIVSDFDIRISDFSGVNYATP
jgi:hypothetical protein